MLHTILKSTLRILAQMYLRKYKPTIVGITGNVGKTSTRDAVAAALSAQGPVKVGVGSINNLWGIPLTIVGSQEELRGYVEQGGTFAFWLGVVFNGFWRLWTVPTYPKMLVLEYGADHPGDIKQLAELFPPHIGVITGIGQTPVHVEFFASPQALAKEKTELLKPLQPDQWAVLNFDDLTVLEMKNQTKARALTFGFGEGADIQVRNFELIPGEKPSGISFDVRSGTGATYPMRLLGTLGRPQALACAAALAVAQTFGIELSRAVEGLRGYQPSAGRMRILEGIKHSTIIDDTYNASPLAMHAALDALREAPLQHIGGQRSRKIAVLGDMLELGEYTEQAHRVVGDRVADIADILVCVGDKAIFIADSASKAMQKHQIFTFHTSVDAQTQVQAIIQEGDVILVKGSQGKRMEKIVEEIMAYPEKKAELLVRQSKRWLEK